MADPSLIVFVHVPKTAGTTVKKHLERHDPAGMAHCESIIGDLDELGKRVADLNWIAGHVPYDRFRSQLEKVTDRKLRFFATMRDPGAQVMSHYNWLIEIHHRGGAFYDNHPERIKRISEQIRQSDNTQPRTVLKNLRTFRGMFLNAQSRVILGTGFNWNRGQVIDRLSHYECIATEATIPDVVERMTGHQMQSEIRENTSGYHFDAAVFRRPGVRKFLYNNNFLDETLYGTVTRPDFDRLVDRPGDRAAKSGSTPPGAG